MQRKAQTGAIRQYCEELQRRDAPEYGVFRSSQKLLRSIHAPRKPISACKAHGCCEIGLCIFKNLKSVVSQSTEKILMLFCGQALRT
jgi:hypothetical protein